MPLRINNGVPILEGLAGALGNPIPANAEPKWRDLKVPRFKQEGNKWCWAACIQMLMGFFGTAAKQCEIAKKLFPGSECCTDQKSCDQTGCDPKEIERMIETQPSNLSCKPDNSDLSFKAIQDEINAERPIGVGIIWREKPGGKALGGHLIIVRGWEIQENGRQWVYVNDPSPTKSGPIKVTYDKLRHYYGRDDDEVDGVWEFTWSEIQRG